MDIPIEDVYEHPLTQELLKEIESVKASDISMADKNLDSIELPYVIKGKILMSPGTWNDNYFTPEAIVNGFRHSDFKNKDVTSLFLDHIDDKSSQWVGEVKNIRMKGPDVIGDLYIVDKPTAIKLAYGAKFGISPRLKALTSNGTVNDFEFRNFSIVINPAVKTAYINNVSGGETEYVVPPTITEEVKMSESKETETQTTAKEQTQINMEELTKAITENVVSQLSKQLSEQIEAEFKKRKKEYPEPYPEPKEEKDKEDKKELKKKKYPEPEEPKDDKAMEEETEPEKETEETALEFDDEAMEELLEFKKKGGKVAAIAKKAKEIRKKGESWTTAIKRAAKMLSDELSEKEPETKTDELSEKIKTLEEENKQLKDTIENLKEPSRLSEKNVEPSDVELSEEELDQAFGAIMKAAQNEGTTKFNWRWQS